MSGPQSDIEALIGLMARLPGLGPRSARRAVLHLLRKRSLLMAPLADAMARAARDTRNCGICGNLTSGDFCAICQDPARSDREICVVEDVADLWAMEAAGIFRGRYHVLGGRLSPLDGIGPEELRVPDLVRRVSTKGSDEVILALSTTVDGQSTAHYIADALTGTGAKTSTLAQGVPVGGELDYLDEGTISAALRARRSF
ncbi:recombination mediator RecR [Falsigemmobacter intermedius]|uniref:recombination mediator RecR n=1 Tax=Falsigemmobacter intermedius TaxID=1553448 RepID=UPI003F0ED491